MRDHSGKTFVSTTPPGSLKENLGQFLAVSDTTETGNPNISNRDKAGVFEETPAHVYLGCSQLSLW